MSSCVAYVLRHEATSADHPVGALCAHWTAAPDGNTAAATAPASPLSRRTSSSQHTGESQMKAQRDSQLVQVTGSRSADTWDDLHPTVHPELWLSEFFLDIFTALQCLFFYLTLALWNYLSTHRDLVLARYGMCYTPCAVNVTATLSVLDTDAIVESVQTQTSSFCFVPVEGERAGSCGHAPGAVAVAYLALVTAGLVLVVGITACVLILNTSSVAQWCERRWCAQHSTPVLQATQEPRDKFTQWLPVISFVVPQYRFTHRVFWGAVDEKVASARLHGTDREAEQDDADRQRSSQRAPTLWRDVLFERDGRSALFWVFSPLVLALVILDAYMVAWDKANPIFSQMGRVGGGELNGDAPFANLGGTGTITVLQVFTLVVGLLVLIDTVRNVALCVVRECLRACFRCVLMMDRQGVL